MGLTAKGVGVPEDSLYYGIDGERYGPVSAEQLRALIASGRLTVGDYLWNEQREDWTPLAQVEEFANDFASAPAGRALRAEPEQPIAAGFFVRLGAHVLDAFFLLLPAMIWAGLSTQLLGVDPESIDAEALGRDPFSPANRADSMLLLRWQAWFYGGLLVLEWLYRAGLESSALQGTLGKRIFGLVVVDTAGRRIGFGRATLRYLCKGLSMLPLGLGFLVILVHEKKQGLHDQIAQTLVLQR